MAPGHGQVRVTEADRPEPVPLAPGVSMVWRQCWCSPSGPRGEPEPAGQSGPHTLSDLCSIHPTQIGGLVSQRPSLLCILRPREGLDAGRGWTQAVAVLRPRDACVGLGGPAGDRSELSSLVAPALAVGTCPGAWKPSAVGCHRAGALGEEHGEGFGGPGWDTANSTWS